MKRIVLIFVLAISLASCSSTAKLMNTATYQRMDFQPYVTPVQVDLEVSPKKMELFMTVSRTVAAGGDDNVVATAVKEALQSTGMDYDVLVGLQTQVKYFETGEIESINITGFPAKYVNFRSNDQLPMKTIEKEEPAGGIGLFGKKK